MFRFLYFLARFFGQLQTSDWSELSGMVSSLAITETVWLHVKQPFVKRSPLINRQKIRNYQNKLDSFIHKTDNKDMDRRAITVKFWFQIERKFCLSEESLFGCLFPLFRRRDNLPQKINGTIQLLIGQFIPIKDSYWAIVRKVDLFSNPSRRNWD